GKWEKSRFMGVEITDKTLGIIGCGNIGAIVAERALGLKMKVVAYDPYLSLERAAALGVEKLELDEMLPRADFISLHTPLTDKTRNILDEKAIASMKPGVRIINCARGGLIDETALVGALESGHVAGAGIDVYSVEPALENQLFSAPNVVCTPHLGAATAEAQEKVALQVAEQMCDYLTTGAIRNAINFPSVTAEEAPSLKPFVALAENLGSFAGQLTESALIRVRIEYAGDVADMNTQALTAAVLTGVLKPQLHDVNMVSAPVIAQQRGIAVEEVRRGREGAYGTYMRLTTTTEQQSRSVAGTVFSDGKSRIIQVKGINMEAELAPHMIYVTNNDKPGFIGNLGRVLGNSQVNIATFHLGRNVPGGDAIALVEVDGAVSDAVLDRVRQIEHVVQAKKLEF
ncbi:MAG: phosphoglycerate dehydrogenase, partial [Hyphomicrobiales bacterium]